MELLFESRTNLSGFSGHLNFVRQRPQVHPEPVMLPDTFADGKGLSIYGSVLRDGGLLRMWYLAIPEDWDYQADMSSVAYAESDDGIHWRKPVLGIVEHGPGANNLVNLALHCPSVFIDPHSPPERRYRATGCGYPALFMAHPEVTTMGYYTAHSADGLRWTLDAAAPTWSSADVITSIYHPGRQQGLIAMKYTPRVGRICRRSIHTATYANGEYSGQVSALYPDEYDDMCAAARGHASCDYYGMGMQGAGSGTVGFLWNYWHDLPYTGNVALYGNSDVTLVYQPDAGGRWLHLPGRADFLAHDAQPWMQGWINTASCPVEMGDEHWLYFSSCPTSHGMALDEQWRPRDRWTEWATRYGRGMIGFARWPKWRLFGFASDPDGSLTIDLGPISQPCELILNYTTRPEGNIRVELLDTPARSLDDALPLTGESTGAPAAWRNETVISPTEKHVLAKVYLEMATVYAYELKTVN